ncbi:hypothetical protein ACFL1M_01380 [Patescibacteria group bacterium]
MTKISTDYYLDLLENTLGAWQNGSEKKIHKVRQDLIDHLVDKYGLNESDVAHLR